MVTMGVRSITEYPPNMNVLSEMPINPPRNPMITGGRPYCRPPTPGASADPGARQTEVPVKRFLTVLLLAVGAMVLTAAPALAHAVLVSSSPTDGENLAVAPGAVSLTFDEDVLAESAQFTLYSGDGTVVARSGTAPGGLTVAVGRSEAGGQSVAARTQLRIGLPALAPGSFALQWRVRSADDLHTTAGSLAFGIGRAASRTTPDRTGPLPDIAATLLRWLDLVALALMSGSILLIWTTVPRSGLAADDRLHWTSLCIRLARCSAMVAIVLGCVGVIQESGRIETLEQAVLGTTFGTLWLLHLLGLAVIALTGNRPRALPRAVILGVALLAVVAGLAATGHVGSAGRRLVPDILLALHLSAGIGWAGAVLLLCAAASRSSLRRQVASVARAFAPAAAACVIALLVTGLVLTGLQVASVDALVTSTYGRVLVAKVALVAIAGGLGGLTFRRLRSGRAGRALPAGRLVLEGVALLLVLIGAAALSNGTPANGPAFDPAVTGQSGPVVTQVDGLLITAGFAPGTVGQNWIRIAVDDTRRPTRAAVARVVLHLTDPSGRTIPDRDLLPGSGSDLWQIGDVTLNRTGPWTVDLAVDRPGLPTTTWQFRWSTGDSTVRPPAVLDDKPWSRVLDWAALTIAALCGTAVGVRMARRRAHHRALPVDPPQNVLDPALL